MAFVNITFDGIERALPEPDALLVAERLRARAGSTPAAVTLADRIEEEARGGTYAGVASEVELDEEEKADLMRVCDELDASAQLTDDIRSLQTALHGERWPGEPGY
jgi:hypothetical protein